jgi:hypothetical protein
MDLPTFFEIGSLGDLALTPPADRHGGSVRVWARSLSVMQKEAIDRRRRGRGRRRGAARLDDRGAALLHRGDELVAIPAL